MKYDINNGLKELMNPYHNIFKDDFLECKRINSFNILNILLLVILLQIYSLMKNYISST